MPCDDCSRTEACPPCPEGEDRPLFAPGAEEYYREVLGLPSKEPKPCTCGPDEACGDPCVREPLCPYACSEGHTYSGSCLLRAYGPGGPEEPPLTPEEEEETPEDPECTCDPRPWSYTDPEPMPDQDCPTHGDPAILAQPQEPSPPQPDRRPPYAVSYSVQGHLFEVALPGDASVRAVDGALVIQHHLGPVAGIVQVLPVINKES